MGECNFIIFNFPSEAHSSHPMSESIYSIIQHEEDPPKKGPIYKSKYPSNIPPTGSTFCHHTTSQIMVGLSLCRALT